MFSLILFGVLAVVLDILGIILIVSGIRDFLKGKGFWGQKDDCKNW